jgi:hypothetical protein
MKTLTLFLFLFILSGISSGQNNNWSTIESRYSAGPIAPEYQYTYSIQINYGGSGIVTIKKADTTNEYNFTVGKKGRKKLNRALNNSMVFEVNPDSLPSGIQLMGGPRRDIVITMWQPSDLDQKPKTIDVPGRVKEEYADGVEKLYDTIKRLVPYSIRKKLEN